MDKVDIFGVQVDNVALDEALQKADEVIRAKSPVYFTIISLYQIVLCKENTGMLNFNNHASLSLVEGANVIRLSKHLGSPIREKIDGTYFTYEICKLAAHKGYNVYILGGSPGSAEAAARNLREINPRLKIAGTYAPPYGFENDKDELQKIVTMLQSSNADILLVGLGSPKQDNFIEKYRNEYDIALSLPIGRGIDIIGGRFKRSPKWISKIGMEWLYRCLQDPELFKRRYFRRGIKVLKYYWQYKRQQ